MALYTPLARLGTFLFPNQSRRVSAPAPCSPHEGLKRRSAVVATNSPPRCRRRLSFADNDTVIEYPPPSPVVSSAVKEAAAGLPNVPVEARMAAWAELAGLATACGSGPGIEEPSLQKLFSWAFCQESTPLLPAMELAAAASTLDAVLARATTPLTLRDEPLVDGVLRAVVMHPDCAALVENVAVIVLREDWGRVFSSVVSAAATSLAAALLRALSSPELEPKTWEAQLHLLSVCSLSISRGPLQAELDYEGTCVLPNRQTYGLQLSQEDALVILGSFERLADRDAGVTASALRALLPVLSNDAVAAVFISANASQVLSEVSSMHAQKIEVQHACIDVLVIVSSPRIFSHAPGM